MLWPHPLDDLSCPKGTHVLAHDFLMLAFDLLVPWVIFRGISTAPLELCSSDSDEPRKEPTVLTNCSDCWTAAARLIFQTFPSPLKRHRVFECLSCTCIPRWYLENFNHGLSKLLIHTGIQFSQSEWPPCLHNNFFGENFYRLGQPTPYRQQSEQHNFYRPLRSLVSVTC